MDHAELLKAIRERSNSDRYGIGTADQYLKAVAGCLDGGYCPRSLNGVTQAEWAGAIKDAEQKFVYSQQGMNVKGVFEASDPSYLLEFDCIVTSTKKDRDGDVLETRGAILDEYAPLLWQHNSFLPLGKVLRRTGQTHAKLTARCCILDFGNGDGELAQLARDAAVLVKANALRISHGFDPRDFKALESEDSRYLISSFEILEVSLVSIPSNTDAVITAFSNHKLHSTVIKSWAEKMYRERPVQGKGVTFDKSHDCHCGGTCDDCKKNAAAHQHGSVRHEGESLDDCVSRKISILEQEGGREHAQNVAIAESMCRDGKSKEQAISDLEKLAALFAKSPKENTVSTETKSPEAVAKNSELPNMRPGPQGGTSPGTESRGQDDAENFLGQGPSQGDRDWNERHNSATVVDQYIPGVCDFNVGNTADDEIMAIAAGGMSGPQRNAAPDTVLSDNAGPAGQPGVPTPTMGIQTPISMPVVLNVSTSPGPQGSRSEPSLSQSVQGPKDAAVPAVKESSVNDARQVTPMDRDSADQHDTAGNIDTHVIVDVPHLKHVAAMIQHSGKEGASYLNPDHGHVHHVAHPDDLHPSNSHMYHGHDEIHKLYKSVRGVKGVKVAIQQHPVKGMGYTLMHKADRVPGADPGMGDGTERVSANPVIKELLNIKGRLEKLFHATKGALSEENKKLLAFAYAGVMQTIKSSGLDPLGNGQSATLPSNNNLDQHSLGSFTGVPADNALNQESLSNFQGGSQPSTGTPTNNAQNVESATGFGQAPQMNTPASNPPTSGKQATAVIQNEHVNGMGGPHENALAEPPPKSRRTDPGTMSNESVDGPNIPGSTAFRENVLNEENVMDWLEESAPALTGESKSSEVDEFDKMVMECEAKEFDEMFAKA